MRNWKILSYLLVVFWVVSGLSLAMAEVKNPDTYIYLGIGEPDTLDPHYAYDTASGEVINFVYENLIAYKGESITEFVPRLATEVPSVENGLIRDDGKTYVFPIRKGVTFHNGNALTPEDVEYSFERGILFDPHAGPMWMIIEALFNYQTIEDFVADKVGIAWSDMFNEDGTLKDPAYEEKLVDFYNQYIDPAIEVEGDNVVFHLVRPFAPFLSILAQNASWGAILDKETCVELGLWDGKPEGWWKYHNLKKEESPLYEKAIGTGPFVLSEWDRTQQKVTLVRNENYWGEKPKIAKAIIWGIDEWSTRRAMLEAGDADQIYTPLQYLDQVKGMENVVIREGARLVITAMHFNWNVVPESKYLGSGKLDGEGIPPDFFSDIHVRKAFCYAFDYETFINEVLNGYAYRIPSVLPRGLLGYNENLPMYQFDLEKAKEELQKAWNGEIWEKGFKLTLLYNTGNEARQTACEMLKENIESLNPKFKIEVQGVQWPTYLDAYRSGQLPAFVIGWLADYPDPHNFIFTYYHSNGVYGTTQGENFIKFAQENLDSLIEEAIAKTNPEERQKLYEEIQKIAYENALGIPFYQPIDIFAMRSWVKGWMFNPMRPGAVNFDGVWKEE
ncbi:MAG: peptide/nickel transport system substrate-binding protein [Candidatus Atribacteria bacterium]|uniref:ABC transporter substrate-binding protein n=1 Tax=Atrimonas thermophila TaxID=3064161 RepID=UPI0024ABA368|nr:peptide/nickel transport system substrate-binding protein [Candidatus Atribacteria bacterium]